MNGIAPLRVRHARGPRRGRATRWLSRLLRAREATLRPRISDDAVENAATLDYVRGVGLRFYRRKSLGGGFWLGMSKSGVSVGRRGGRVSTSVGKRGGRGSIRLARGLSWRFRR
jgi:hypothetical protein